MFKGLLIAVLCTGLAACGSSSDKPAQEVGPQRTLDVDFERFKGSDGATPQLTSVEVANGDDVVINSRLMGSAETTFTGFKYEANATQPVALFLNSEAENFDLLVFAALPDNSLPSLDDLVAAGASSDSNEALVFAAVAGESYTILIIASNFAGEIDDFELVITEAHRASLGLLDDEFFYSGDAGYYENCDDGSISTSDLPRQANFIVNFNSGYLEIFPSADRFEFDSVSDNRIVASRENNTQTDDRSFNRKSSMILDLNLDDGSFTAIEEGTTTTKYDDGTKFCTFTNIIESELLF